MSSENKKDGYDIFISFDRSDRESKKCAKEFYSELKTRYSVFSISKYLNSKKIEESLRKSDALLLLCNNPSVSSYKALCNECNIFYDQEKQGSAFIFEVTGFKKENIPDILVRKNIPREKDLDKQIESIEKWRKPPIVSVRTTQHGSAVTDEKPKGITLKQVVIGVISSIIAAIIIYLFTLFCSFFASFFSCSNNAPSLEFTVKDTTLYINDTLDLQELLKVIPDTAHVTWQHKVGATTEKITETKLKVQPADSGLYFASIKNRKDGIISDSLYVHVKNPCEERSVKIDPTNNTKYNAPIELDKTIRVILDGFENDFKKEWRTDNGKKVFRAEQTGNYVVSVTDGLCKEVKSDTIYIIIDEKSIVDSLNLDPPTRLNWKKIVGDYDMEIDNLTADEVFSKYISNRTKIWNEKEFEFFLETITYRSVIYPKGNPETDNVIVFNKKGRIMEQFPKGKSSAKNNKIEYYRGKGYTIRAFRINF